MKSQQATMEVVAKVLANLATTNTASTSILQDLTNQLVALITKDDQLNSQTEQLQATVKALKTNRAATTTSSTHCNNGNYCWMHGYRISSTHPSKTCQNPAPGHCKEATRANTMGGSQAGKPKE